MPDEGLPQPAADLCSEQEVTALVHRFYARVREDELLGPVFGARVHDWDAHLAQLVDFWSAMLRGTRRFRGAPMPKHMAMDELNAGLFERWLQLFRQTTAELGNAPMQRLADDVAARIADTFWRRFQMLRWPSLPMHGAGS
ncbi:group III truncated hemoglobin [Flavobacterium sp. MXW15]|uniref:Group III truncated hemoglobin n=1 Tax=Xanthomonas chitinilytica TaxID=2989819 RepID=A0ABT3K024_9XANT|nr:group III truncated hemoglobin [Xanthomonas sp. H13-6]MCW4456355.1 group III truncated hemoglobin [Flavobacterium sp. MXW15]MCW4474061.1 group III truncated hemoglobin [Xanthomonas sp. H13-6]